MRPTAILAALALLAAPAVAETLRIGGPGPTVLHAGPGGFFPEVGALRPGQLAERGACDGAGRWCLLSTDAVVGWARAADLRRGEGLEAYLRRGPGRGRALGRDRDPGRPFEVPATPLPPPPPVVAMPRITAPSPAADVVPGARPPRLLSTTVPMRNVTDGLLNLRARPGTDAPVIGTLRPGEGGRIDLCDATESWCRIAPAGLPSGWVSTRLIGLRRM